MPHSSVIQIPNSGFSPRSERVSDAPVSAGFRFLPKLSEREKWYGINRAPIPDAIRCFSFFRKKSAGHRGKRRRVWPILGSGSPLSVYEKEGEDGLVAFPPGIHPKSYANAIRLVGNPGREGTVPRTDVE